jgi:4-hydroxybenzoate polyprenyltransferase
MGDGKVGAARADAPATPRLGAMLRLLAVAIRPRQWLKNGLIFLPFLFSVGEVWHPLAVNEWLPLLARAVVAALAFCAVSSAGYLVNDLRDVERDRHHPRKRHRPLASGALDVRAAQGAAVGLLLVGAALAALLTWRFGAVLAGYGALSFLYSLVLKHLAIVDLLALALGFVFRAVAGGVAIAVPISPWLYLCTLLGALFIAITKRRHELASLGDGAAGHRPILSQYSVPLLDQMTTIVTTSTVMAYALYTVTAPNLPASGSMLATVPFVLYGIFRYLYLVHERDAGGSPEEVLLRDRPLQLSVLLWGATAVTILLIARP